MGKGEVKPKQRQTGILGVVAEAGEASVEALAARFGVSAETIRRDLAHLAESGALQKVHGGARRLRLHAEGSYRERMAQDAGAKTMIARKLAGIVAPGDTLFMDTGTTTVACAAALVAVPGLTVITNELRVAQVLGQGDARVFLLGGAYAHDNAETVGPLVIEQIGRFQADHAVLTVTAVDTLAGATDADPDEALVSRAMIDHARTTVVVANAAKLGRVAAFRVCRLDQIDMLVCDETPPDAFVAAVQAAGVDLR